MDYFGINSVFDLIAVLALMALCFFFFFKKKSYRLMVIYIVFLLIYVGVFLLNVFYRMELAFAIANLFSRLCHSRAYSGISSISRQYSLT